MIGYKLPLSLDKEIDELADLVGRFQKGEVSAAELKAHRVPFGVYEQRRRGTYMVRARCAAGIATPAQLEAVALLSRQFASGQIHVTTRQELQIHEVNLENVISIIRGLKQIGLASRGGGGNTVRNVTAQEDAGIDPLEVFDVTGYAVSLTSRLLAENDSWTLPRKFKIAFSGSADDKGYATLADVGFIACLQDKKPGFRVYAAGGMGGKSQVGQLLFDFIECGEVYFVVRAIKNIFWKYGNRKNKHAARLRFLWQSLGAGEFKKRFQAEYEASKKEGAGGLLVEEIENTGLFPDLDLGEFENNADFVLWKRRFSRPQRQPGLFCLTVPVPLGFIDSQRLLKLARCLESFGDNVVRMTKEQNFLIRNIPEKYLGFVYGRLAQALENFNRPFILDKIISCAGASTCQLGICLSRGAARAIIETLSRDPGLALDKLAQIKINISGCPNACGQHLAADLGFFGKAARKNDSLYPAYNVILGAVVRDKETKFAEKIGEVSARDLPRLVRDFLSGYLAQSGSYPDIREYIRRQGAADLEQICRNYQHVPDFSEDKNYYYDWGAPEVFSLAGRGSGECSAGLFDLIELDLKNIRETEEKLAAGGQDQGRCLMELIFYSCRMLLITRALEPKTEQEVYDYFCRFFVDTGLLDASLREVIALARDKNIAGLLQRQPEAAALSGRVRFLYEHMDNSFNFEADAAPQMEKTPARQSCARRVMDFRGVACPMNFVKTKMELAKIKPKEILEVWLDDGEPIQSVPGSLREEGHLILEQRKKDGFWSVVIEKK